MRDGAKGSGCFSTLSTSGTFLKPFFSSSTSNGQWLYNGTSLFAALSRRYRGNIALAVLKTFSEAGGSSAELLFMGDSNVRFMVMGLVSVLDPLAARSWRSYDNYPHLMRFDTILSPSMAAKGGVVAITNVSLDSRIKELSLGSRFVRVKFQWAPTVAEQRVVRQSLASATKK